jgi:hypothetical protein
MVDVPSGEERGGRVSQDRSGRGNPSAPLPGFGSHEPLPDEADLENNRDLTHVSYPSVRSAFRERAARPGTSDRDLLPAAILAYGGVSGQLRPESRYWVEKTPFNEVHAARIFSWWGDAKAIHVVRDPRDHFCTLRQRGIRKGTLCLAESGPPSIGTALGQGGRPRTVRCSPLEGHRGTAVGIRPDAEAHRRNPRSAHHGAAVRWQYPGLPGNP